MAQGEFDYLRQDTFMPRPAYMSTPVVLPSRFKLARILSYGALKRSFDLITSSVLLVGLLPLFAVVAVAIKIDSHGPVFFRQKRREHSRYRSR